MIEEILADKEVQKSLFAVMEYLEGILVSRRNISGDDYSQHEINFSKVDMSAKMLVGNQVAATT